MAEVKINIDTDKIQIGDIVSFEISKAGEPLPLISSDTKVQKIYSDKYRYNLNANSFISYIENDALLEENVNINVEEGIVRSIVSTPTKFFLGGLFTRVKHGDIRNIIANNLIVYDKEEDKLTDINIDGEVYSILVDEDNNYLIVGGRLSMRNGKRIKNLHFIDLNTLEDIDHINNSLDINNYSIVKKVVKVNDEYWIGGKNLQTIISSERSAPIIKNIISINIQGENTLTSFPKYIDGAECIVNDIYYNKDEQKIGIGGKFKNDHCFDILSIGGKSLFLPNKLYTFKPDTSVVNTISGGTDSFSLAGSFNFVISDSDITETYNAVVMDLNDSTFPVLYDLKGLNGEIYSSVFVKGAGQQFLYGGRFNDVEGIECLNLFYKDFSTNYTQGYQVGNNMLNSSVNYIVEDLHNISTEYLIGGEFTMFSNYDTTVEEDDKFTIKYTGDVRLDFYKNLDQTVNGDIDIGGGAIGIDVIYNDPEDDAIYYVNRRFLPVDFDSLVNPIRAAITEGYQFKEVIQREIKCRSDYNHQYRTIANQSKVNFTMIKNSGLYETDWDPNELHNFTKFKIASNQSKIYFNVSDLMRRELNPNLDTFFIPDIHTPRDIPSGFYEFLRISERGWNSEDLWSEPIYTNYIINDGYVFNHEYQGYVKNVLIEGNKRQIHRDQFFRLYYKTEGLRRIRREFIKDDGSLYKHIFHNFLGNQELDIRKYVQSLVVNTFPNDNNFIEHKPKWIDYIFEYENPRSSYLPNVKETVRFYISDECVYKGGFLNSIGINPVGNIETKLNKNILYQIVFLNKWGVLETVSLQGKSVQTVERKGEDYKRSIVDINGDYDTTIHQQVDYNVNSNDKYVLSTGFLKEFMNPVFEDLMVSDKIWLITDKDVLTVVMKKSSLTVKTVKNDKLINYTFEVESGSTRIKNYI